MPTFMYLGLLNWKGTKRSYQLSNRASHRSSHTRILVISLEKVLSVYQMWKVVRNVCARSRRLFGVFVLVKGSLVVMKAGLGTRRVCGNGCGGCGCGSLNLNPHQTHTRFGGLRVCAMARLVVSHQLATIVTATARIAAR